MDIREFKNIYKEYSPSIIWDWCAKPSAEEIDAKLYAFSQMGISRVFIRPSKGLVLPYLSEDYFELIRTCARRGGKYGVTIGICDETTPCSGNGGGEITSVPDYRMRDILNVSKRDIDKNDDIIYEDSEGALVLRDMSRMRASGRIPLADITDAFVTECFSDAVYDKYIKQCQRFMGEEIKEFMTQVTIPENAVVFSPSAQKKSGISDLTLLAEGSGAEYEKYALSLSECIADNYIGILGEKCRKNSLQLSLSIDVSEKIPPQAQYIKADNISLIADSVNPDFAQIKLAQTISEQFDKPLYIRLLLPTFAQCSARYNKSAFFTSLGADGIIFDSVAFSLSDRRKYEPHSVALSQFAEEDISNRLARLAFIVSSTSTNAQKLIIFSSQNRDWAYSVTEELMKKGVTFHLMEENLFRKHCSLIHGMAVVGQCSYNHLIVPSEDFTIPEGFAGKLTTREQFDVEEILSESICCLNINGDTIINRRYSEDDEFLFITASKDTEITYTPESKKLFVADCSNGEIYAVSSTEGLCKFKIKGGKTAILILSDSISADIAPPFTDDIEFAPRTAQQDISFALSSAEENILPLKRVNACFGRKSYRESSIDALHKEFYSLRDGETVKVKYPFTVDIQNTGKVKAYIENADNLDFVEINGKRLDGFAPSEKDPRFFGIDITENLAEGKNTIAVEYKKSNNYTSDFSSITPSHFYSYNITSFEPVYLCGDFDCSENALIKLDAYDEDITKSGMSYYYGSLTYAVRLPEKDLSGSVLLVEGDFDICKIKIGKRSQTFFCETPMLEVFNLDCDAVAEITIYNTPFNLMRTADEDAQPFGIKEIRLCKFSY